MQKEQAIDVDDDTWIAGLGVQSANLVLADLSKLLGLTIDQTTVAALATADTFPITIEHKNDPLGGATSFVSVLSLPFLLDGLAPQLVDALDGTTR